MAYPPADSRAPVRGSVAVALTVAAPPERVFAALVEPDLARNWFGALSVSLAEGERARLDFEDGDFFLLDSVHLEPPTRLTYGWRFLGLGPRDAIEWQIAPHPDGARVAVTDTDPLRAPDWNDELREGWEDFTSRLARHLSTGENARYDWRRQLDGGIELECSESAARRLLDPTVLPAWLPSGGVPPRAGAWWRLGDGVEPSRVRVRKATVAAHVGCECEIDHPDWRASTVVTLSLRARGPHTMLTFSHNGWERLAGGHAYQKRQRQRFAALWIAALAQARALVTFAPSAR